MISIRNPLSRRSFLGIGVMATAASFVPSTNAAWAGQANPSSGMLSPLQLGLASYTFRNFDRAQLIGFMKKLNISKLNAKDVKDHLPLDPHGEARALADYAAAGIKLHAAGTISLNKNDADLKNKFEYCKTAGIPVMVAAGPPLHNLPLIEQFVREYDIRVAIHNHGPEDKQWASPLDVLNAVKNMDLRIGCCMDVGHTVRAGTDVVKAVHAAGPRLLNVHFKDLTDFQRRESQVAVGEGKLPIRAIFEALVAIQYKGSVDLEYEIHPDDPMPGVASSFAYMSNTLSALGSAKTE